MTSGRSRSDDPECSICSAPWKLFFDGEEIGANLERYSFLIRCPKCGRFYESYGFGKENPRKVSLNEARRLFPGVDPLGPATKAPVSERIP